MKNSTDNPESPFSQTYVALDLETTGLTASQDAIIEVGAVKFRPGEVLETYSKLVNPYRQISPFIQELTGITQKELDQSKPFTALEAEVTEFVGSNIVVGQNVQFDLSFLAHNGVHLSKNYFDTRDLGYVLIQNDNYSLAGLAKYFSVENSRPHRALPDAVATSEIFTKLLEYSQKLDIGMLAEINRICALARWPLRILFNGLEAEKKGRAGAGSEPLSVLGGIDTKKLNNRLRQFNEVPDGKSVPDKAANIEDLVRADGPISEVLDQYEYREQQKTMMEETDALLNNGGILTIEAGTGVGKTLAYLLPACLYALKNNKTIIISTETINLQEQLINKDIPLVKSLLKQLWKLSDIPLNAAVLKGRDNYLCLKRWNNLRAGQNLTTQEARVLSKVLVWMSTTSTGDKSELNLAPRDLPAWRRISSYGVKECPTRDAPCFLQGARERADKAQILVINHALLLSDASSEGGLLPKSSHLVIDEAHKLDEQATKQYGLSLTQDEIELHVQRTMGRRGIGQEAVDAYRTSTTAGDRLNNTRSVNERYANSLTKVKESLQTLFGLASHFASEFTERQNSELRDFRITDSLRAQPLWSEIEIAWENLDIGLGHVHKYTSDLLESLSGLELNGLLGYEQLRASIGDYLDANTQHRVTLRNFFTEPDESFVYWMSEGNRGSIVLNTAPLDVGDILKETLFDQKTSVVLTGATLSSSGSFASFHKKLGIDNSKEITLGSPFDYKRVLLCIPKDMPEPGSKDYDSGLASAISQLVSISEGRAMALFTSNSSLKSVYNAIAEPMNKKNINVLAQGINGYPAQLVDSFINNPKSVILGTNSFWEGVDIPGVNLKLLLITKLPFDVPTDPIFQARSEFLEDPFTEYSLPNAIIRFRQGFGRIMRSAQDKGSVVLLDRRLTSRSYGKYFLDSLPNCTEEHLSVGDIGPKLASWLQD